VRSPHPAGRPYGSRVRGDRSEPSDLNVVIDRRVHFSLYDLSRLHQTLSEALGIEAEVTTYGSVHPRLRRRILSEELRILG